MEHFVETDILGLLVGSNGTVVNNTGIQLVKYAQSGVVYVGFELSKNKRVMKKLSHLVYQYHINRGRPIDEDFTVDHRDGDRNNYSMENLYLRAKGVRQSVDIRYNSNKGTRREISLKPLVVHPNWMLNDNSKAG